MRLLLFDDGYGESDYLEVYTMVGSAECTAAYGGFE
jgi:hypothetical protein